MNYTNFKAKKVDNPTKTATINELVKITCLWWTNICIICDLNDKLFAPLDGECSSLVAKGDKTKDKTTFKRIPIKEAIKTIFKFLFI